MFYSNETPTGTINGVNKTFTTANTINTIMTVTVDGSIYTGTNTYTAGTTTFTLADAPTVSITVSYFTSATGITPSDGILVSTLKTQFGYRKQDISDVGNETFFQWCNHINYFLYNKIKGTRINDFLSSGQYTVTTSPSSQALPSDFRDMEEDKSGVFVISTTGDDTPTQLPLTGFGRSDMGYYLDGSDIVFTGIEDSTTLELRYLPNLNEIDEVTDRLIVGADKLQYLLNALDVLYEIWDDNPQAEANADQRFVRSLEELLENISPTVLVYQMNDPMINY